MVQAYANHHLQMCSMSVVISVFFSVVCGISLKEKDNNAYYKKKIKQLFPGRFTSTMSRQTLLMKPCTS